jgi:hypothetical protein
VGGRTHLVAQSDARMDVAASVARASLHDTAGAVTDVLVPLAARGVIARRRRVAALGDRIDADRRAIRRMQRLRDRYEPGPLLLQLPGRKAALLLTPDHVNHVLAKTRSRSRPPISRSERRWPTSNRTAC